MVFAKEFIKSLDIFALPVLLFLNRKREYKTFLGGIVSIITIFFFMIYFFSSCGQFFNKENVEIQF